MEAEIREINFWETLYDNLCFDFGVSIFDILSLLPFKEHQFQDN